MTDTDILEQDTFVPADTDGDTDPLLRDTFNQVGNQGAGAMYCGQQNTQSYELPDGITSVRYIRVVGLSEATTDNLADDSRVGFDLDGLGAHHVGLLDSDSDCDDADGRVNPGLAEVPYDGVDNDCDPDTLDDDLDGDGFALADDCDDTDESRNPGLPETPYNGVDDDRDDATADDDLDGDGFVLADDCDDTDESRNPGLAGDAVQRRRRRLRRRDRRRRPRRRRIRLGRRLRRHRREPESWSAGDARTTASTTTVQ